MAESEWGGDLQNYALDPPERHHDTTSVVRYLRNESNIFSVDRGINQKRTENCINARSALLQKFSILFSVETSIIRKNIKFISYHLIFISFQQWNQSTFFKRRIISNFWRCRDTFDVKIQYFGWCKIHLNFLTNQNTRLVITLVNIKWFKDSMIILSGTCPTLKESDDSRRLCIPIFKFLHHIFKYYW